MLTHNGVPYLLGKHNNYLFDTFFFAFPQTNLQHFPKKQQTNSLLGTTKTTRGCWCQLSQFASDQSSYLNPSTGCHYHYHYGQCYHFWPNQCNHSNQGILTLEVISTALYQFIQLWRPTQQDQTSWLCKLCLCFSYLSSLQQRASVRGSKWGQCGKTAAVRPWK